MSAQSAMPIGMIVFKIGEQEFCFDVRFLIGNLKPGELDFYRSQDSEHPDRVVFDGQDYLLIDIASLLGAKNQAGSDPSWILMVEYGEQKLAFQVEAVTQIITGLGGKDSPFGFVPTKDVPNRLGYFKTQTREIWEIDFDGVIRDLPCFRGSV